MAINATAIRARRGLVPDGKSPKLLRSFVSIWSTIPRGTDLPIRATRRRLTHPVELAAAEDLGRAAVRCSAAD